MARAVLGLVIVALFAPSEAWIAQQSGTTASLRGLDAVDARVAWASGANGTFARTVDGGTTWQPGTVGGAETLDFRDVEALDANRATLLTAGDDARIYQTVDGGKTWTLRFKRTGPNVFFDAIAFWDERHGIAFGDPVDGRFVVITTADGGVTWRDVPPERIPPVIEGEAAFAASGTCLVVEGRNNAWIATGGGRISRVFQTTDRGRTWSVAEAPVAAGKASAGIFSLAFRDGKNGVAVGGDYEQPGVAVDNVAITSDGGRTWRKASGPLPKGYRSCVVWAPVGKERALVAVGTNGSDISYDGGHSWRPIGTTGFNSVAFAGKAGWAAGPEGRIAKWN